MDSTLDRILQNCCASGWGIGRPGRGPRAPCAAPDRLFCQPRMASLQSPGTGCSNTGPEVMRRGVPPSAGVGGIMTIRRISRLAGVAAVALAVLGAAPAQAAYPERPITLIVPWGAGGGTDATGRILASLMEKQLGVPVTVVNRTGGSGVVGHSAIATAAADGYTLGVITVEIGMMHWQGLPDLT